MTDLSRSRTRRYALMASLILGLSLWIAPGAVAKYRPPQTPSAPKDTTRPNITRGGSCDSVGGTQSANLSSEIGLTPLAPLSHVGQTTSVRPTFVWFVVDRVPHRLEFRLFTRTGQPLYRAQLQSQPGIMSITLPPDQPGLAIGQSYVWQVVLVCNPNAPSMNVVATAKIAVVKPSATLQPQLAAAQTPQQRIDRYAESGLWYDALAEAQKSSRPAVLDLLNSLASSEAQSQKNWSDRLIQIQNSEQQR